MTANWKTWCRLCGSPNSAFAIEYFPEIDKIIKECLNVSFNKIKCRKNPSIICFLALNHPGQDVQRMPELPERDQQLSDKNKNYRQNVPGIPGDWSIQQHKIGQSNPE
jgi:hypothetical protein